MRMRAHITALMLARSVGLAAQQPGTLDTTFALDGTLELPDVVQGYATVSATQVIRQEASGSVLFLSLSDTCLRFFRILENGSLDSSFFGGSWDIVSSSISTQFSLDTVIFDMVQVADPEVYVRLLNGVDDYIIRIMVDGFAIDPNFGNSGLKALEWDLLDQQTILGFKLLSTGGAVVWGQYDTPSCAWDISSAYVMRVDEQFEPMSSYGTDALLMYPACNSLMSVQQVAEMPEGQLAVGLFLASAPPSISGNGSSYVSIHDVAGNLLSYDGVPTWPGGWERILNSMHCSAFGTLLVGVGDQYGKLWIKKWSEPFAGLWGVWYEIGAFVNRMASDQQGNFLIAHGYQRMIGRRTPNGLRDQTFGTLNIGDDPSSRWAEVPYPHTDVAALVPLATGKLLVIGPYFWDGEYRLRFARYHNIPDPRSTLSLRMFLGGAYDSTNSLMRDEMREQGLVPTLQPFDAAFFSAANGVGQWATPQHVLAVEGDSAVVDWVWLELLSTADSSNVMATRVGLLHRNGWVTSADGHSPIDFSAGAGSYFVRARHRNHLGVTASQPIVLGPSVTTLDLTDPATATFGTDAQEEINGVRMLWPGDANSDGAVKYLGAYNDRDRILVAIGGNTPTATLSGYRTEDVNLDGVTKYVGTANDRDIILQVIGGVPTAVRVAQQP